MGNPNKLRDKLVQAAQRAGWRKEPDDDLYPGAPVSTLVLHKASHDRIYIEFTKRGGVSRVMRGNQTIRGRVTERDLLKMIG